VKLAKLAALLPPDLDIVVADVGSAGGLAKRWRPISERVSAVLFDPRADPGSGSGGRVRHYRFALGGAPGSARLYVTALGNMSSLLEPNAMLLERFRNKGAHTRVTATIDVLIETLDDIVQRDGLQVDVLKADTQGTELEILRGASASLDHSVFLAEVEVSFIERYKAQPRFEDVVCFMRERGFELLDLQRLKRYRFLNRGGVDNIGLGGGMRAGRLAYGDAVFALNESALLARMQALAPGARQCLALKVILVLLVYGKPDYAAHWFDTTSDLLERDVRGNLARYFAELRRRRYTLGGVPLLLDFLARRF
jgi:FkbM family methyltransferase